VSTRTHGSISGRELYEVVLSSRCAVTVVCHLRAGNGGWSAKGCEVVFRNSTHISCQCYHMTSFAVLMDVSRREVSETKTSPKTKISSHFCVIDQLNVMFASERGDPAHQNLDMEHSWCDTGLPLPHHNLPLVSESHAVQQDKYNQQRSHCSLPLRAHLHPGH